MSLIIKRRWNQLNIIKQIAEKSPPIFRWLQSVFSHSDHLLSANSKVNLQWIVQILFVIISILLREIPSGRQVFEDKTSFEWPRQSCGIATPAWLGKVIETCIEMIFILHARWFNSLIFVVTQMTRMCWPFSELGVDEKTPMFKVPSPIAGI
jgi:hypothetical protein